MNFKEGMVPWSTYKGIKDELNRLNQTNLYFYVTKYFMDNYDEDDICNYIFTVKEYKDLIKHFMNECNTFKEDDAYQINENNEAEYEGFLLVEHCDE